jgi:hypothetical protein
VTKRIAGEREMLWIEYTSHALTTHLEVYEILEDIARIIHPHPVAAYDRRNDGLYLLAAGRRIQTSEGTSQIFDPGKCDPTSADLSPSDYGESITIGDPQNESNDSSGQQEDTNDRAADGHNERNGCHVSQTENPSSKETTSMSGHLDTSCENDGDDSDDDDDGNECKGPPGGPDDKSGRELHGMIRGTVSLSLKKDVLQNLHLRFDLAISPKVSGQSVKCHISLDNIILGAGKCSKKGAQPPSYLPPQPFFLLEKTRIFVSPIEGQCTPGPSEPHAHWFVTKVIPFSQNQFSLNLQAQMPPVSANFVHGRGKSRGERGILNEIELGEIGGAEGDGYHWNYRHRTNYQSSFEMSSSAPPVHKIQYVYDTRPKSAVPQKFVTRLEVLYRRRNIPPRILSFLPPVFRLNRDISAFHLLISLEAAVDNTMKDHFRFPTEKKMGAHRRLNINYFGREIGEGIPSKEALGEGIAVSLSRQMK